jgi:hypothetical protein
MATGSAVDNSSTGWESRCASQRRQTGFYIRLSPICDSLRISIGDEDADRVRAGLHREIFAASCSMSNALLIRLHEEGRCWRVAPPPSGWPLIGTAQRCPLQRLVGRSGAAQLPRYGPKEDTILISYWVSFRLF